jgi:membrane protein YdbS with pleckstrin-like domain
MADNTLHMEPIRRSAAALAIRLFLLLFMIDTVYALLILGFMYISPPHEYYPMFVAFLWLLHTAKYIFITVVMLRTVLGWLGKSYLISGHHLITHDGIYRVDEKVYELDQLKAIDIHQDWIGRRFHYGNIKLALSAHGYNEQVELVDVAEPEKYEHVLEESF